MKDVRYLFKAWVECSRCKAMNKKSDKYCLECGARL